MGEAHFQGLACEGLCAGWGDTEVLSGIGFRLPAGETLAVLGRNGVGKTTLVSAIAGRATRRAGSIAFDGRPLDGLPSYARARLGIRLVPQEREIFPSLTVEENLTVAAQRRGRSGWTLERVYDLFPRLAERRGNGGARLSGGEQQMLSIGRALMGNPSLLLMDEPMEGLAPIIVDQLVEALHRLRAEAEMAILLVEQHVGLAMEFTRRFIVLDRGAVIHDNAAGAHPLEVAEIEALVGVAHA